MYRHVSFVLLLKNLLLDFEIHDQLPLGDIVEDIISHLYSSLDVKSASFTGEELKLIGARPINKDSDNFLLMESVECLILIGTRCEGRRILRSHQGLYPMLRELDKQQASNSSLKEEIEKLVGYLIREDEVNL